uniref:Uncharacterized protein n=1 Tax=Anguilla anguilla TaxID=7936 RepID=A0A0E9V6J6_ANGAN
MPRTQSSAGLLTVYFCQPFQFTFKEMSRQNSKDSGSWAKQVLPPERSART